MQQIPQNWQIQVCRLKVKIGKIFCQQNSTLLMVQTMDQRSYSFSILILEDCNWHLLIYLKELTAQGAVKQRVKLLI